MNFPIHGSLLNRVLNSRGGIHPHLCSAGDDDLHDGGGSSHCGHQPLGEREPTGLTVCKNSLTGKMYSWYRCIKKVYTNRISIFPGVSKKNSFHILVILRIHSFFEAMDSLGFLCPVRSWEFEAWDF